MSAPLEGIVVVALEQAVAAPFATRQLADLGATVLKVERPGEGDFARHYDAKMVGQSAFFIWGNRAKQSIALDLKDPADDATFRALIAGADVFIQNLSPGAAQRAGVDAATLVARHPHLIACDVSGYGYGGPLTEAKAYDLAIQAEAGAMALTGSAEEMSKVGFSVADISAAMYAFSGILAALVRRERTGEGAAIEVTMLESMAEWTAVPVYTAAYTGEVPARAGHRHALIAPYGLFTLSDGRRLMVAVQFDAEWRALAEHVLGDAALGTDSRFATNPDRIANVGEVEALVNGAFAAAAPEVILARLERAKVVHAWARDPLDVWRHPQLAARDRFTDVETPTGTARMYRSPFHISGCPEPSARVPALGEHDPDLVARLVQQPKPSASG